MLNSQGGSRLRLVVFGLVGVVGVLVVLVVWLLTRSESESELEQLAGQINDALAEDELVKEQALADLQASAAERQERLATREGWFDAQFGVNEANEDQVSVREFAVSLVNLDYAAAPREQILAELEESFYDLELYPSLDTDSLRQTSLEHSVPILFDDRLLAGQLAAASYQGLLTSEGCVRVRSSSMSDIFPTELVELEAEQNDGVLLPSQTLLYMVCPVYYTLDLIEITEDGGRQTHHSEYRTDFAIAAYRDQIIYIGPTTEIPNT